MQQDKINKPQSAFNGLDIKKIKSGHRFTEGTWNRGIGTGINKDAGLKGQLRRFQIAGRYGVTKNLSTQNIKQIYGLLADRINRKVASSGDLLNRWDKYALMKESRKMVKENGSNFTWEDRKDLLKIVDRLRDKNRDSLHARNEDVIAPSSPSYSATPASNPPQTPSVASSSTRVNLSPLPSNLNFPKRKV